MTAEEWSELFNLNISDSYYSFSSPRLPDFLLESPVSTLNFLAAPGGGSGGGGGGVSPLIFDAPQLVLASSTPTRWIVDSGASVHIVSSPLLLDRIDIQIAPIQMYCADGICVRILY
jgi:hypothetical protein